MLTMVRSLLLPLNLGILRYIRPAEPGARGHIQVVSPEATRTGREEVERRAVERERGRAVEGCTIDRRPEVDRRGPPVEGGGPGRDPQILAADPTHAAFGVRRQEDLKPVPPDRRAGVAKRPAQLRDENRWSKLALIALAGARVDVEVTGATRPGAREVERRDARGLVLEDRRARIVERGVHDAPQVLRWLPAEVVPLVV